VSKPAETKPARRERKQRQRTALSAHGEPLLWLTGGAMATALLMIIGLLAFVVVQGFGTFLPERLVEVTTVQGQRWLGEVSLTETYQPEERVFAALPEAARAAARDRVQAQGGSQRRMLRVENYELTGEHYKWFSDFELAGEREPEWAVLVERREGGRFHGYPSHFLLDGEKVATTPAEAWARYEAERDPSARRHEQAQELEREEIGAVNLRMERARLAVRKAELEHGAESPERAAAEAQRQALAPALQAEYDAIGQRIQALRKENLRQQIVFTTADGTEKAIPVSEIVLAYPANQLSFWGRTGIYLHRWGEFLVDDPRESNSEGGVFPAIFGTVLMTLVMSILVVPFGVLAALYLREYAKPGLLVSFVRIAVNNLAGVPSIVFGVFGLGFFCYAIGTSVDDLLFAEKLPNPTYGKGGMLWASLTLALLTLPVVIVATEEALSAVPGSMREGSYACGASKWQTIRRIVLPRAMPGIMTGMILAIARGAGEVAPLMLVGAAKLAPELPLDLHFPYIHPERSFLHLGFHIYDLGFQSQNSEAAKPMVYTTTLLLIGVIVILNVTAIIVRGKLRRRFQSTHI
jgi:phosphate transport system permease protein